MNHLTLAISVLSTLAIATAQPAVPSPQVPVRPGVVTGLLRTSTGLPLEEIQIAVFPVDRSIPFGALERQGLTGLTDSAGRYRLENISPGRYYILIGVNGARFFYPGVANPGRTFGEQLPAGVGQIEVTAGATLEVPDTVVSGGTVTGRVVDMVTGRGHRIENLVLCCDYFKQVLFSKAGQKRGSPFTTTLSDDGSFVFPFVPPGNYALSVLDRSVIPVSWVITVGPNGVTGLQLDVTEGVEVQGTVLNQSGKPVSASVRLVPKPTTSASITNGAASMYTGAGPRLLDNGTPQGTRTFLMGILVPKADPSLADIRNVILEASEIRERSVTPEPDGRFAFQNVYPSAYALEVRSGTVTLPEREIQVGITGLASVSFQVSAMEVKGRVIAPSGGSLPKLNYVRLVRSGSETDIFYGFPDKEGLFSVALLPGQYRVFTDSLGPSVQSVTNGSRDITNTEFTLEAANPQIVVTLSP